MKMVLRLLLVPLLGFAGFLLYGQAIALSAEWITPPRNHFFWIVLLAQCFVASAAVPVLLSYPIAYIYRRAAILVALCVVAPILWLRVPEMPQVDMHDISFLISAYELGAFAVLFVCGTWLTSRRFVQKTVPARMRAQVRSLSGKN